MHERQSQYADHTHKPAQPKHPPKPPFLASLHPQIPDNRHRQHPNRPISHNANDTRASKVMLSVHTPPIDLHVPVRLDWVTQEDDAKNTPYGCTEN